jgi:hypothetical protein
MMILSSYRAGILFASGFVKLETDAHGFLTDCGYVDEYFHGFGIFWHISGGNGRLFRNELGSKISLN